MQIAERPISQPPKIVSQPKIKDTEVISTKTVLSEKSVKYIEYVEPVAKKTVKPTISEITPDHVKQTHGTKDIM